ncbi:hypothetical protein MIS46_05160 [Wielerella bovis]|uniref:hypothetical protein n=1 Tax=Wielerella bovis TaxID=2917790 RepID=UPI002019B133|nr:hypothetical protein [Wielerella bovis]ULJ63435.1 hypothetical protein MIS46_05160 [Wielerella bovis]
MKSVLVIIYIFRQPYSKARILLLPCLLNMTLPLNLPDCLSLGIQPQKATTCAALVN